MTLSDARRNLFSLLPPPQSGNSSGFTLSTSSENELFENCTTSLLSNLSGIEDELDANDELDDENEDYDYVNLIDDNIYDTLNKQKTRELLE